jgi:hypothetical protein
VADIVFGTALSGIRIYFDPVQNQFAVIGVRLHCPIILDIGRKYATGSN